VGRLEMTERGPTLDARPLSSHVRASNAGPPSEVRRDEAARARERRTDPEIGGPVSRGFVLVPFIVATAVIAVGFDRWPASAADSPASLTIRAGRAHLTRPITRTGLDRIASNDNRASAGTLRGNTLTIALEARIASWYPEGDNGPSVDIPAFAEVGKPAQVPGPLVRVSAGTRVTATIHNTLPNDTLTVHGLYTRAPGSAAAPPIRLAPGERRTVEFSLDATGSYYYWATTTGRPLTQRFREDAQLSGALIVDPAGSPRPRDRVFVIGMWSDTTGNANPHWRQRVLFVLNGRSWPHTERLAYTVGDTVRWHVLNPTADIHPMHLHGFYFRVEGRGDGITDTTYAEADRDRLVTELLTQGQTMRLSWVPERDGNWAFHCHIPNHIEHRGPLGTLPPAATHHGADHATQGMSNLVLAVHVDPRRGEPSTATTAAPGRRQFRLVIDETPNATIGFPDLTYALGERGTEPRRAAAGRLGPPIIVGAGEPISITVVNRSAYPTTVHWHGIELESYFDGIAGLSGVPSKLSPMIAPRDSFEARFTPPRPGTFIYHSHVDESRQQAAGLTGAIVVLAPGDRFDPSTDLFAVVTSPPDSATEMRAVLINGALDPAPLRMRVGVAHRVRIINITMGRPGLRLELQRDTTVIQWRILARDGAELPPERKVMRRAVQPLSIGQTMDVEITPTTTDPLRLEARGASGLRLGSLEIRPVP
jgi:manganese oxidase